MVKKLLTLALGLTLAFGATAQLSNNDGHELPPQRKSVTFSASDVQYWVGTGSNSAVVIIGWDDNPNGNFALAWGVHWNGSATAANMLDTIATYDERTTYTGISSGFMTGFYYNDGSLVSGSSASYWCYTINGSYASAYGSQAMADGDVMEISSSCMFSLTTATAATNPNAGASCARAQSVSVANITTTSVDVTVNDTANVNNYTLRLFAGTTLVDSAIITTHTYTFSGLTANTAYKVTLVSNCSDGTQTYELNTSFRTPCVTIAHADLPWSEDFQSYNGMSYSSSSVSFASQVFCWDLKNAYSASDPYVNNSTSVNVSGGKCLYVSSRVTSPTILVLPPFEDSPEALQLSFDVLSTYRHGFKVGVMSDVAVDSTFTPIATCLPDGNGWTHFDVSFAGFTEGRLALRSNDNGPAYLDNVTVSELPSCVRPSQVLVSNVTSSSADITIVDPNGTNHYMVYAAGDSVEVYSNSYTISDLQPNMRYVVSVRTLCADTTTGVTEAVFRTACGIIATPYHENFNQFEDVSNGFGYAVADSTLPCWGFLKARSLDRLEVFPRSQSVTYAYGDEGYTMRIYGNYSDSRDIVVLPEFDQEISNLEISFVARPSENGNYGGTLQVGYVTDATDSSSFVSVVGYASSQFTNGFDFCTSLFVDAPAGSRIALRYLPSGGSAKSWYVDEIDVHEMPACVRAQSISVDNITTDGFTLHVADPTLVNHYRYYLTAGGVSDSADFYDTVVVVDGIMASTDYELRVVSVCSDGALTLPQTMSVSTLCAPVAQLPFEEGFEDWTATQSQGMNRCWNRLYMNSSNSLVTNNYPYCATGSGNAYEGFKSLKMYSKGTTSDIKEYSVAYLPEFEDGVNTLKVSFMYKYGGTTYNINKVKIAVGVSDNVSDTTTFTRLATLTPTVVGWNEFEVELSGYAGTGRRIAIMQTSTGTTAITSYIDNLTVDTISSCNRPATLTADSVSAYGATLVWTDPSEAGSYLVRWSDGVNADSITITGATTYALTGLIPSTTYTVDVRSICWSNPTNARSASFTTSCAPMPLPWEMNFDNMTNISQLSSCWNRYSGLYVDSTQSATLTSASSGWSLSTTAFESSPHIKVNIYGTSCKYWIVTPEISLTENAELTFDYMLTDYNNADAPEAVPGADDRFAVLATTDNGTSWTPVALWGSDTARDDYALATVSNTVSQASISLSAFTGQTVRLAFYGESTVSGSDNDFRIDNLSVHAATADTTTPQPPVNPCATAQVLPYQEDFSGYVSNQSIRPHMAGAMMPECWTAVGNGTTQYAYTPNSETSTYFGGIGYSTSTNSFGAIAANDAFLALIGSQIYTGDNADHIADMNATGTSRYAILPTFEQALSQTVLTFDRRTSSNGARLVVGYITSDTATFVGLDTMAADNRVLHHDTVRFSQYAGMPADARLTFKWEVTSTTASTTGPGYRYCGIDNLLVAIDTTTPAPIDTIEPGTITNSDILFWAGHGPDSAIVIINWVDEDDTPTTYAWGLAFDDDEGVFVSDVLDSLDTYDPRFYYHYSRYMGSIFEMDMVRFVDDDDSLYTVTAGVNYYNCLKLDGMMLDASEFEDEWINPGSLIEISTDCYFVYGTVVPVTPPSVTPGPPADPIDATIAFSDILYWVGTGADSAVFIVNYAQPDTAFAWGYLFNGSTTAQTMVNDIAAADPRFWTDGSPSMSGDIHFILDNGDTLGLSPVDPTVGYNFWWTNLNGVSAGAGASSTLHNGDVFKYGDMNSAIGWDFQYGYYMQEAWTKAPTPVSVPDTTTTPVDTTETPVEATIAASDILYWVGEGSNEAVMAVNWADTALAWGYRYNGIATVTDMMDAIAAADPRFSYTGTGFLADILYIDTAAGMTDTLRITAGNYWESKNNGLSDAGMAQALSNGDFEKWSDPAAGIVVDSSSYEYDGVTYWIYTSVYPMTIHPVTVPDTTGTSPVEPPVPEHGPFCGAVGTEGCNAIAADSSAIVAWATGCTVVRGPVDITDPEGPVVHYGADSMAIGPAGTSTTVAVSLGDGGTATLTFATPIRNGEGPDFAVFENSFNDLFLELAFVEVSSDGERFVRFPATSLTQTETQVVSVVDPTFINNLAGKFRVGYGTPFDLEELRDSTGINVDSIVYVRIVDVVGTIDPEYATYDAFGHIVNDPWPTSDTVWGSGGFDLTGVAVLNEYVAPQPIGIEDIDLAIEAVWPNPATDRVNVAVSRSVEAQLFDLSGRMVGSYRLLEGNNVIDLASFAEGVYMLRAEGTVHKIVKKR
ncbi:MAG: choice-of-anchor J domain-containing protein [Bacteroidales bacterium]|nr:choice-of-anchor J domain-containing protein [Bacteroidales bacterium]